MLKGTLVRIDLCLQQSLSRTYIEGDVIYPSNIYVQPIGYTLLSLHPLRVLAGSFCHLRWHTQPSIAGCYLLRILCFVVESCSYTLYQRVYKDTCTLTSRVFIFRLPDHPVISSRVIRLHSAQGELTSIHAYNCMRYNHLRRSSGSRLPGDSRHILLCPHHQVLIYTLSVNPLHSTSIPGSLCAGPYPG
jgi:hypothetical protein